MELKWNGRGDLRFFVHFKPNQKLKYLNDGSCHTKCCLKAILRDVIKRLAKLTSKTNENLESTSNELYSKHAEALRRAGIAPKEFPLLNEVEGELNENNDKEKKRVRNFTSQIFFCVGVSKAFQGKHAIHVTFKN